MDPSLEILTLNAWGIPGIWPICSKNKHERMDAIADYLLKNSFDVVTLQEIWSADDYELIRRRVENVLPYSHYFYSGFLGSGVCIFTKGKIVEVLIHRYSLNGYAHHIHRGDWFGGKIVGLTRIRFKNIDKIINFYSTHCHAEYNKANDSYLPHRLVQALELSQFVNATSLANDFVFVAGDFNLESTDLGYRVIVTNAHLKDAWLTRKHSDADQDGYTCDSPTNCYTKSNATPKRIDYILYKYQTPYEILIEDCKPIMGRIDENHPLNYSDHEGVYAKVLFRPSVRGMQILGVCFYREEVSTSEKESRRSDLIEAINLMDKEMVSVGRIRTYYAILAAILFVVLFLSIDVEIHFPTLIFIILALFFRFATTLTIGFCIWFGVIVLKTEENAFREAKEEINILLQNDE